MGSKTKKVLSTTEEKKEATQETTDDLNETHELLSDVFDGIEKNIKNRKEFIGINSGIEKLDYQLQGFREGDLNIIASRPAIGKTMLALNMFTNITAQGINALYISFDKYENDLLKSILSIKTKINISRLELGFLSTDNFKVILETTKEITENTSMFFKSFNNTDLNKLRNFIKEKTEKDKIKIVFIDYLTLIISAPIYSNRWEQVAEISRSLKSMAMEFKIPFIVLSPIHRNLVDKPPEIADLSESGSIEYDADRVIILYKKPEKKKYNEDFDDADNTRITVYIAKNRRGPTTTFDLLFNYKNKLIADVKND